MSADFAYLVVEQRTGPASVSDLPSMPDPPDVPDGPLIVRRTNDENASFADRLYGTLLSATESPGYASHLNLMRPTPSRIEHVDRVVSAGLLDKSQAASLFSAGKVPDTAWAVLGAIDPTLGTAQVIPSARAVAASAKRAPSRRISKPTPPTTIRYWSLRLHRHDVVSDLTVDAKKVAARALPVADIASTLGKLARDGWSVVQAFEDKAIDDAANSSYVIRVRFLLKK